MTANQSPPARPDGDMLEERMKFELSISSPYDYRSWASIVGALHRAIVTSPARDAAEGENVCYLERSKVREIALRENKEILKEVDALPIFNADDFAPPKPAPDAVRKALEKIQQRANEPGNDILAWQETVHDMHRIAKAALSAPVPPADGALAKRFTEWVERYAEKMCPPGCLPLPAQEREISLFAEIVRAFAATGTPADGTPNEDALLDFIRSPSAASAAEPVTETVPLANHDEIGRKVLNQPLEIQNAIVTIAAHCTVLTDEHPTGVVADIAGCISQGCLELANALATPPVRGDREAIARIIAPEAFVPDYQHYWPDRSMLEQFEAFKKADAILSLPVQPGAGERETLRKALKRVRLFIDALVKDAERRTGQPAIGGRQELEVIDNALSGASAKPQTCLDEVGLKITGELYKAVLGHIGDACLLAMIGSWGDTLDDPDILAGLQRYNEMGECFIPDVSRRQPPQSSSDGGPSSPQVTESPHE